MRNSVVIMLLCLCMGLAHAQNTNISGQINRYSKVTDIFYCGNRVVVDSPTLFSAGMQVLLIQMQGAIIDPSNNSNYGNILTYADAGNYEIETIDSVIGDTIKFSFEIEKHYDPAHSVQLIPLPVYQTATVSSKLISQAWNGRTGGVLVLKADTLILNDTISVSGQGFRGFTNNDSSQLCWGNLTDYFFGDSTHGELKGEGIIQATYQYGRGKNANGGGGGNNQNTGGGGGGSYGRGGVGGRIVYRTISCQGNGPGDGGVALRFDDTLARVFMGGGGGCGHQNNSEGTGGENGGGICIIMARVLIGNNKAIIADGRAQSRTAGSDGAGGGGAGGAVLLSVGTYTGSLTVSAKGGAGGKLDNDFLARSCMGPGGGGGGGVLWLSQTSLPAGISFDAPGGAAGFNLANTSFCPFGATNGALAGDSGGISTGLAIPISARPYIRLSATISHDTLLCNDQQFTIYSIGTSSDPTHYIWSTGQTSPIISFLATTSGPYAVSVSDDNSCLVVASTNLTVEHVTPNFSHDTALCTPATISLHAENTGSTAVTYAWSTGSASPFITFLADSSRIYTVTVSSTTGCKDSATMNVTVSNLSIAFSNDTAICRGQSATIGTQVLAGSHASYLWSTGDTTPSITVSPLADRSYAVTVTNQGPCRFVHSYRVTIDYLGIIPSADTTICPGGTATLTATVPNANNVHYNWSTGDTLRQIHKTTITSQTYTVEAINDVGCMGSASINVHVDSILVNTSRDTAICPASPAILSVGVQGIGTINYVWSSGQRTAAITVSPGANQNYTIVATDSLGCSATGNVSVTANNSIHNLNVQITAVPDSALYPGDSVQLSVSGMRLMTFSWSPGINLNDSMIQAPISRALRGTDYCVMVSDSNNCRALVCRYINVGIPPSDIALPNAFSPNGDGVNDVYKVMPANGTIISALKIYNRWGELVYDGDNDGWDGTVRGVLQPSDTYSSFITFYQKLYPEKPFYKMGNFMLMK